MKRCLVQCLCSSRFSHFSCFYMASSFDRIQCLSLEFTMVQHLADHPFQFHNLRSLYTRDYTMPCGAVTAQHPPYLNKYSLPNVSQSLSTQVFSPLPNHNFFRIWLFPRKPKSSSQIFFNPCQQFPLHQKWHPASPPARLVNQSRSPRPNPHAARLVSRSRSPSLPPIRPPLHNSHMTKSHIC
jgi:hypothetical protein